jgi:choline-sulfatase
MREGGTPRGVPLSSGFIRPTGDDACPPRSMAGMNVVNVFITDQDRAIQHFPRGWVKENLPGLTRLQRHGLTFSNAFTNSCMCSPARATLMTGYFPAQHGVKYTLELDMPADEYPQVEMPLDLANLATVMSAAGYNVVYKGKWHLNKPADGASGCPRTWGSTASRAGTRRTPGPTRTSPRPAAATPTTTAAS